MTFGWIGMISQLLHSLREKTKRLARKPERAAEGEVEGEVELMNSRCANKTRTNESDWSIKLLRFGPEKRLERIHFPSAQPFRFN